MRIQLRVILVMAFAAGLFTQLLGPRTALSRDAFAATASLDRLLCAERCCPAGRDGETAPQSN